MKQLRNPHKPHAITAFAVALCLFAVGCSSGSAGGVSVAPPTGPAASDGVTSSTASETTAPSTTVNVPDTTSPSTTQPPPSTTEVLSPAQQAAVEAARRRTIDLKTASDRCEAAPDDCDPRQSLLTEFFVPDPSRDERYPKYFEDMARNNERVEAIDRNTYDVVQVHSNTSGDIALATVCVRDGSVRVKTVDGKREVLDDDIGYWRIDYFWERQPNGDWKVDWNRRVYSYPERSVPDIAGCTFADASPTSTIAPDTKAAAQKGLLAAINGYHQHVDVCNSDPANCDIDGFINEYLPDYPWLGDALRDHWTWLRENGQHVEHAERNSYDVTEIAYNHNHTQAVVIQCVTYGHVRMPNGNPKDTSRRYETNVTEWVQAQNGRWRIRSALFAPADTPDRPTCNTTG